MSANKTDIYKATHAISALTGSQHYGQHSASSQPWTHKIYTPADVTLQTVANQVNQPGLGDQCDVATFSANGGYSQCELRYASFMGKFKGHSEPLAMQLANSLAAEVPQANADASLRKYSWRTNQGNTQHANNARVEARRVNLAGQLGIQAQVPRQPADSMMHAKQSTQAYPLFDMMALEHVIPPAAINFAGKSRSFRHDEQGSKVKPIQLAASLAPRATSPATSSAMPTASSSEVPANNFLSLPQVGKDAEVFHDSSRNQSETSCVTQLKHVKNSSVGSATRADSFSSTQGSRVHDARRAPLQEVDVQKRMLQDVGVSSKKTNAISDEQKPHAQQQIFGVPSIFSLPCDLDASAHQQASDDESYSDACRDSELDDVTAEVSHSASVNQVGSIVEALALEAEALKVLSQSRRRMSRIQSKESTNGANATEITQKYGKSSSSRLETWLNGASSEPQSDNEQIAAQVSVDMLDENEESSCVKYDVDGLQASRRRKPLTSDVPAVDSFKKLLAAEKSPFLSPPMNGAQESYMSNLDAQASRKRFNSQFLGEKELLGCALSSELQGDAHYLKKNLAGGLTFGCGGKISEMSTRYSFSYSETVHNMPRRDSNHSSEERKSQMSTTTLATAIGQKIEVGIPKNTDEQEVLRKFQAIWSDEPAAKKHASQDQTELPLKTKKVNLHQQLFRTDQQHNHSSIVPQISGVTQMPLRVFQKSPEDKENCAHNSQIEPNAPRRKITLANQLKPYSGEHRAWNFTHQMQPIPGMSCLSDSMQRSFALTEFILRQTIPAGKS